jgi:hypothetical protein
VIRLQLKTVAPNPNIWLLAVDFWFMTNDSQAKLLHSNSWFGVPRCGTQWMYFTLCWLLTVDLKKVKVMLRLMVGQSVCLSAESILELVTRYYFLSESCCVVSVARPLWWEVGSVSCQSLSAVSKFNSNYVLHVTYVLCIYNIYKASVSPGSVQQIMPHRL